MQAVLVSVLGQATGVPVVWAKTHEHHESIAGDFVSVRVMSGPSPVVRAHQRGRLVEPVESVTLTVPATVDAVRYGLWLNDFLYYYDAALVDTPNTVRDALVTAVESDLDETATATAGVSVGELNLTADFVGGIRSLRSLRLTSSSLVLASSSVFLTEGTQVVTLVATVYSKSRGPRNGAQKLGAQVLAGLQSHDLTEELRRFGVGCTMKMPLMDVSVIEGGRWESRAELQFELTMKSSWVRPVDSIETVKVNTDYFNIG